MSRQIIKYEWQLKLDVDQIIWSQGANPEVIRQRRPQVVQLAQRALDTEWEFIQPVLAYRDIQVEGFYHDRLLLVGGESLQGEFVSTRLAAAKQIIVGLYTIGMEFDTRLTVALEEGLPYGLAVDGMGTAAVDAFGDEVRAFFEHEAQTSDWELSMSMCPGMIGWPLLEGQEQIFKLLDADEINVSVSKDTGRMEPRKTISFIYGMGDNMSEGNTNACDYCQVKETCRYRGRHG
jgi:hypothetical protein